MHDFTHFAVSVDDGVAHLEFNRPEQANANSACASYKS